MEVAASSFQDLMRIVKEPEKGEPDLRQYNFHTSITRFSRFESHSEFTQGINRHTTWEGLPSLETRVPAFLQ
jgi:hypothetical protein